MDFQHCRPTEYAYSIFDNVNDSRMWKTFKTVYGLNNIASRTDAVVTANGVTVDQVPTLGDQGIIFILNKKSDAHCDVIMARTGETYLIKAEAQVRLGNFPDAISTINQLRLRAEWKDDEDREYYTDGSMAFLKSTGGDVDNSTALSTLGKCKDANGTKINNTEAFKVSFLQKNTYYLSTGIERTTAASSLQIASYSLLPDEDEAILSAMGVSGDKARLINFILNERTRECLGEWNRWEELSRTKTLIQRAKLFNPEAATNIADKHLLRPIPQTFLDQLQHEDGTNLSDEEKAAMQNPGY